MATTIERVQYSAERHREFADAMPETQQCERASAKGTPCPCSASSAAVTRRRGQWHGKYLCSGHAVLYRRTIRVNAQRCDHGIVSVLSF